MYWVLYNHEVMQNYFYVIPKRSLKRHKTIQKYFELNNKEWTFYIF
jgi:hypothetical protein